MIVSSEWQKPEEKPHFHETNLSWAHVSLDCIEKLVEWMESIGIEEMD
jgi:hypothetical protein